MTLSQIQEWLPQRGLNPNKYENGYVFGIAGSRSFPGAAVLSATAAAKVGAGGIRCLVPQSVWPIMAAHVVEIMLQSVMETEDGGIALEALSEISSFTERCKAGWAGCGDVLAGVCAGLLGQGLSPFQAAVVGMYLSGMASDAHHQAFGGHTLMASDLLTQIPFVLGKVYSV